MKTVPLISHPSRASFPSVLRQQDGITLASPREGPFFNSLLKDQIADGMLTGELREILKQRHKIGAALGDSAATGEQITKRMREMRLAELEQRKDVYLRCRIGDQKAWYGAKAKYNRRSSKRWLIAVGLTQSLGIVAAICLVAWPEFEINFSVMLTAVAAAFLTWLQVRRSQELAQSYGMAAQELGFVEAMAQHVTTEDEFASFVADAENAISREHTMWVARRDTIP